ncbi:UNVERIFIED_CONTAM: type IA DNA topoisomerase [Streptococcus canis]|uniref:type IA DNA topoisomerase n=1 Tax=Streptococcus canis TaxID=1329 RepID=UPI000B8B2A40|nr:DNA topoisomerase [Streptococcus canis]MDW7797664.1 DNA topoisomerase [Streptococcus canis]QJD13056.1 type IA DNA topoisomerase [Streptococcus canis]VTR80725.1 DNA topoisomerase III [Streptococcus canis]GFE42903.1 DNA topoisomerase III [Streptococcus canis]GFG48173.1 DNA topoisomerase III [Streptococcus canis]
MHTLLLAEKTEQAKAYLTCLGQSKKEKGYFSITSTPYFSGEVRVVASEGHLFDYVLPENNWDLNQLPLTDVHFRQKLKSTKQAKETFQTIYHLVEWADEIVIATDSDREGERIAYSILSHIPQGLEKITKRLWVNSLTKRGLEQAFLNLRDPKETYAYYLEAEARSQCDWLVGMNLSPLVTLSLQAQGHVAKTLSVGRVQTPLVRLICENDVAIRDFVPTPYFKMALEDQRSGQLFVSEDKWLSSESVLSASRHLTNSATIREIQGEEVRKLAPPLFNLSDLQSYSAKQAGLSSQETLQITEKLYLKGYLSYPRTDCRYISAFEFSDLKEHLLDYQKAINVTFEPAYLGERDTYVNAKKVQKQSHHALIPTDKIPILTSLSREERFIYEAVTKRSLLMFAADCRYHITSIRLDNSGIVFKGQGRYLIDKGWTALVSSSVRKDKVLPDYHVGESVLVASRIVEGNTKPPKRLTESHLIGQVMPKYGLGTPATRGGVIETIQKRGYVTKDKKTGQLFPTPLAYILVNYLLDNDFSDPETTSGWELFLSQIGEGELSPRDFVDGIKEKLNQEVEQVKEEMMNDRH